MLGILKRGEIILDEDIQSWTDEQLMKKAEELETEIQRLARERATILKEISRRKRWVRYEEFKNRILKLLMDEPEGLTWTEIKKKLDLPQRVPSNKWVRMLEKDIGLVRIKGAKGIVWRLSKWMK